MQPLIGRLRGRFSGYENAVFRQVGIAACVYLVVAVTAVATGYVYLRPPGQRTMAFDINDAVAVHPGNEVRVAGVPSGHVASVRLVGDAVRVELTIDDDVFVGDQSTVSVRMLTAAGGYYVSLDSKGSKPLGNATIPAERASAPYQLTELLADSAAKLQQVDARQLGEDLDRLANGLETNPGAISTISQGVQALAQIANRQRDQLHNIFDTTQELVNTAEQNRPMLIDLIQNAALLLTLWDSIKYGITQASLGIGRLFDALGNVGVKFYNGHRDWLLDVLQRTNNALNVINTDIPRIVWNLGNFIDNLRKAVSPDGRRIIPQDQLLTTDVCVPAAGRSC
ncbi:Mce family protein [Mycobacteroides abscessus subsp. abscessus]|nr:Mce family protein [Mycobacteroides abscessus subsp. abscessus]